MDIISNDKKSIIPRKYLVASIALNTVMTLVIIALSIITLNLRREISLYDKNNIVYPVDYDMNKYAHDIGEQLLEKSLIGNIEQFDYEIRSFKGLMEVYRKCHSAGIYFKSIPDYVTKMGYRADRQTISKEFSFWLHELLRNTYGNLGTITEFSEKIRIEEKARILYEAYVDFEKRRNKDVLFTFEDFYKTIMYDSIEE